jgi:predicted DNA binding protein
MESDVVLVNVPIKMPPKKWLSILSKKLPHFEILIQSVVPISKSIGHCILQISRNEISSYIDVIMKHNLRTEPIILHQTDNLIIISIKLKDPWIVSTVFKNRAMIKFPIKVQDGFVFLNLIGKRTDIDSIFTQFETKEIMYNIKQIGKYRRQKIFTKKQEAVIKKSHELGFYDIPRKISLTELAKKFHISPSALSELLRRIQKKFTYDYLNSTEI